MAPASKLMKEQDTSPPTRDHRHELERVDR